MHQFSQLAIKPLSFSYNLAIALLWLGLQFFSGSAMAVTSTTPQVVTGQAHTCALSSIGTVTCWGNNSYGQLGNGTTTGSLTPVSVTGLGSGVGAITAGAFHTCAISSSGVVCWGNNANGQLGNGTTTQQLTPVAVGLNAVAITAGNVHTCALILNSSLHQMYCWGWNGYGQLGNGTTTTELTPVRVSGLIDPLAISAGFSHTCTYDSISNRPGSGVTNCWGNNGDGQLGNNSLANALTPVMGDSGDKVTAGGGYHTCSLTNYASGGGVQCWGYNAYGQLGNGTTTTELTPVAVSGLTNVVSAITAGLFHTCTLLSNPGSVQCWGYNAYGQLGNGTYANELTPVAVTGLSSIMAIGSSEASNHTCAISSSGGVYCWGNNSNGQLGNGTLSNQSSPVTVMFADATPLNLLYNLTLIAPTNGVITSIGIYCGTGCNGSYAIGSSVTLT